MNEYSVTFSKMVVTCKVLPKDNRLLEGEIDNIKKHSLTEVTIFLIVPEEEYSQEVLAFSSFHPNWKKEFICRELSNLVAIELIKSMKVEFPNHEVKLHRREWVKVKWVEYGRDVDVKKLINEILN